MALLPSIRTARSPPRALMYRLTTGSPAPVVVVENPGLSESSTYPFFTTVVPVVCLCRRPAASRLRVVVVVPRVIEAAASVS